MRQYVAYGKLITSVLGQNGSGQNGMGKMVWTICYVDKMVLDKMVLDKMVRTKWYAWTKCYTYKMLTDKMVWTNWYGQKGTDKKVRTKCSGDKMLQRNDWCTKNMGQFKLKRLIHRKLTLNSKLKSII